MNRSNTSANKDIGHIVKDMMRLLVAYGVAVLFMGRAWSLRTLGGMTGLAAIFVLLYVLGKEEQYLYNGGNSGNRGPAAIHYRGSEGIFSVSDPGVQSGKRTVAETRQMLQRHGKKSRGSAAYRICGKKGAVQQVSVFFEEDQHPHGACCVYCGIGTGTGTDF